MIAAAILILGLAFLGYFTPWVVIAPIMLYLFGSSVVFANAFTIALSSIDEAKGMAVSLYGFVQMFGGAAFSSYFAHILDVSQVPLGVGLLVASLMAMTSSMILNEKKQVASG